MRKFIFSIIYLFSFLILFSCASKQAEESVVSEPVTVKTDNKTQETIITEDDIEIYEDDSVVMIDEVVLSDDDDEYLRSLEDLSTTEVSKEEFTEDKAAILEIISELSVIMDKKDTNAWLSYIDEESKRYYSSPANIRKAQKKLPDKTLQLHGIGDYFKYVFIPSRKRSKVDEIRYISKTNIKAVEVKDDNSVIIYYYFVKENGEWLVHIPPLS